MTTRRTPRESLDHIRDRIEEELRHARVDLDKLPELASTAAERIRGMLTEMEKMVARPAPETGEAPAREVATYAVIIERGETNYGGYVPDLPGVVATGDTPEQVKASLAAAAHSYVEELRHSGGSVPPPSTVVDTIPVNMGPPAS